MTLAATMNFSIRPKKVTSEPEPEISLPVPRYVSSLPLQAADFEFPVDESEVRRKTL